MADYGVYKGPKKKAAAPASASSDLGSSSSYASTERPAPAVPSSRGYAPAQSQERFEVRKSFFFFVCLTLWAAAGGLQRCRYLQ